MATNKTAQAPETGEVLIPIYLPLRESDGGVDPDQNEYVEIANVGGPAKRILVCRGTHMNVSEEVFRQLKNRFPYL